MLPCHTPLALHRAYHRRTAPLLWQGGTRLRGETGGTPELTIRESVAPEGEILPGPEGMEIAVTTAVAAKRWQASARKGIARRGSAPSLLGVARDKSEEGPRNKGVVGVS